MATCLAPGLVMTAEAQEGAGRVLAIGCCGLLGLT